MADACSVVGFDQDIAAAARTALRRVTARLQHKNPRHFTAGVFHLVQRMRLVKPITLLFAGLFALAAGAAAAEDYRLGSLEISHPWARATPKGATIGAAYMKITNKGTTPDRLIGGSSPLAESIEIHEMTMTGDVMRMRPLATGLEIKPGESVEAKPSSYHIMLVGLKRQLQAGEHVKGTLVFEKAGPIEIEYAVQPVGAMGISTAPAGHEMGPGHEMGHETGAGHEMPAGNAAPAAPGQHGH